MTIWWTYNLIRFSRSRHFWSRISKKRCVFGKSYYRPLIENHIQSVEWHHFQWPWLTHDRDLKVAIFFDIEYLRNDTRQSPLYYTTSVGSHMRSIEWWHFQWLWGTPNPVFKVTAYLKSNISKRTKLLWNTNRKLYPVYRMIPLSMTLIGSWLGFQGRHIFSTLTISETTRNKAMITIERQQKVIGSLSNGDIFNDLLGPLTRFSRSRYFWSRISQYLADKITIAAIAILSARYWDIRLQNIVWYSIAH